MEHMMVLCWFALLMFWIYDREWCSPSVSSNKDRSARLQSNYITTTTTTRRRGNIQIRSRRWSLISITSDDKFNFTCNIYSRRRRWRRTDGNGVSQCSGCNKWRSLALVVSRVWNICIIYAPITCFRDPPLGLHACFWRSNRDHVENRKLYIKLSARGNQS